MESALKKPTMVEIPISDEELAFFETILQEAKAAPAVLKEALEALETYYKKE